MKKIVVNSTNVFIDLRDIGLLDEFFCLPWKIHTTDLVMLELHRDDHSKIIKVYETNGNLHVAKFEFNELLQINHLYKELKSTTNLSLTDCSVWYYAKQNSYTILTEDCKLYSSALNETIEVRNIIYILDALVEYKIIPKKTASKKLTLLKEHNPRLPQNEIENRLKLWSNEQGERRQSMIH